MPIKDVIIELDIPDGYEITDIFYNPQRDVADITRPDLLTIGKSLHAECRRIEPPLELETHCFEQPQCCFNVYALDQIDIAKRIRLNKAEVRDLIKILTHYLEKGKLPERVVVKGGE